MITLQEAKKIAVQERPYLRVIDSSELQSEYLIILEPKDYDKTQNGIFIGGAVVVDKETGEISEYNPLLKDR